MCRRGGVVSTRWSGVAVTVLLVGVSMVTVHGRAVAGDIRSPVTVGRHHVIIIIIIDDHRQKHRTHQRLVASRSQHSSTSITPSQRPRPDDLRRLCRGLLRRQQPPWRCCPLLSSACASLVAAMLSLPEHVRPPLPIRGTLQAALDLLLGTSTSPISSRSSEKTPFKVSNVLL